MALYPLRSKIVILPQVNNTVVTGVNVFQAIIVTRILYALPAWGCFLSKELTGRIDAFLKRCYRCSFASDIERVGTLYDDACMKLFHKIRYLDTVCMTFCLLKMASTMTCASVPILLCCLSVIVIF